MTKFKFSLEKVLDFRWGIEKEAKRVYGELQRQKIEQEQALLEIQNEKNELMEVPEYTINRMQIRQWYLVELDRQMSVAQQSILELQQQIDQALENYVAAQKDRKVLEKLREKQLEEFQIELSREEQKQLDDMANRPNLFA